MAVKCEMTKRDAREHSSLKFNFYVNVLVDFVRASAYSYQC